MMICLFYIVFMLSCYLIFKNILNSVVIVMFWEMLICEVKEIEVRLICIR